MSDKNRFEFVNNPSEALDLNTELSELNKQKSEENIEKSKKKDRMRYIRAAIILFVISVLLVLGGILWQDDTSLMAIGDALWLAFAIEFFAGWTLLVYNLNIWSPLLYGAKSFVLMFIGKRPKTDYYNYMKNIQDNQIPKFYYISIFISAFILLIPALITLFILL